ncbi:MAG: thiamine pyrophosphate-binding protein [Chitinispirillaceae bacterium]|nr:thiamine pyrophosphate-binding protein [Chitinispirillaceae bacterium]
MIGNNSSQSIKVSDYIAEYLKSIGVNSAFGMTGGAITHTIDSLCRAGIKFFSFSHEQGAIFAASGATKSDNKIRVVLATSGPGATNLITGIGDAFFDSIPMLIITGQVNTYDFKWDKNCRQLGFQETDIVKIAAPITKMAKLVSSPELLPHDLVEAIKVAINGRPGPVLLDIPMDIQRALIKTEILEAPSIVSIPPGISDVSWVMDALSKSFRPVILLGNGCKLADCKNDLDKFVNSIHIPVVVSILGKGCIDEHNQNYLGFIGSYGHRYANIALAQADLILAIGSRLDSRQTGNKKEVYSGKLVVQVDIDPAEVGNNIFIDKHIYSDAKTFFLTANSYLEEKTLQVNFTAWNNGLHKIRKNYSRQVEFLRAQANAFEYDVVQALSQEMASNTALCADIGQVQMIAAQELQITGEQQFITSGGMAPMGYSLSAAIGITLETDRPAICLCGDGGIQLSIQEFSILSRKKLPVLIVIMDNKSLGMIKQFQELYFEGRYYATDEDHGYYSPDFQKIAMAYNIPAMHISNSEEDWREKIAFAFTQSWPYVIHISLNYETKVYPKLRFDTTIDNPEPPLTPLELQSIYDELIGLGQQIFENNK